MRCVSKPLGNITTNHQWLLSFVDLSLLLLLLVSHQNWFMFLFIVRKYSVPFLILFRMENFSILFLYFNSEVGGLHFFFSTSKWKFTFHILGSYVTKASCYRTEKIQNKYHIVMRHQNHRRGIEVGSIFDQCARSLVVDAASGELFESDDQPQHFAKPFWGSIKYYLDAFSRFNKPYVLIGTVKQILFFFLQN